MNRLWSAFDPMGADGEGSLRGFFLGQFLALLAAVATLAAQLVLGRLFGASVYLFSMPALLVCSGLGGRASGLTATLILAAGAYVADAYGGLPEPERIARVALFLVLGAAVAYLGGWLRRQFRDLRRSLDRRDEQEAILRASLDAVSDASVTIDESGAIVSFNAAAEALFGWTARELRGQDLKVLMPPDEAAAHDGHLQRYLQTRERHVIGSSRQVLARRRDGSDFPMELHIAELRIGPRRYFTGVMRDLTTMRDAVRRSDQLQAQLTQIWSLNSMGEMASVLAHELNQPLSAVANYLRAARTLIANLEIDEDDLIDAVSRAGDQAVRAGEIIRTMRDLATRGGTEQKPESLSAIIDEIRFIINLMARDADARVSYNLHNGSDIVLADRIQVQQLIVNLVRNAIDAIAKFPDREIRISTRVGEDRKIVMTVEDSGPGVDPAVSGRVFQPLASTKPTGMGLGLSICRAIVENHGGRIWVEPSPLGGAAFSFVLARTGANGDDAGGRTDRIRRR